MVCGIGAYIIITHFILVNLHISFVSIVVHGSILAISIIDFWEPMRLLWLMTHILYHPTIVNPPLSLMNWIKVSKAVRIFIEDLVSWIMYNLHEPRISVLVYNFLTFNKYKSSILSYCVFQFVQWLHVEWTNLYY